jgi:hypothetical protein
MMLDLHSRWNGWCCIISFPTCLAIINSWSWIHYSCSFYTHWNLHSKTVLLILGHRTWSSLGHHPNWHWFFKCNHHVRKQQRYKTNMTHCLLVSPWSLRSKLSKVSSLQDPWRDQFKRLLGQEPLSSSIGQPNLRLPSECAALNAITDWRGVT